MSQPQQQQLYVIPRTQGDITRFVWVAFLIFGLVTVLTFALVTQYTAWQFRFHPTLGPPAAIFGRTSDGRYPRNRQTGNSPGNSKKNIIIVILYLQSLHLQKEEWPLKKQEKNYLF